MDKYSVLMTAYIKSDAKAFETSLASMVSQTYKPDQIVIVWDGPVEQELKKIVNKYADNNKELFTVVELTENHGLAYALNAGLEKVRNDLVARMDSDDYSLPERCRLQVQAFEENPEFVLLGTQIKFFSGTPDNILDQTRRFPTDIAEIRAVLRRNSPFSHPTVMFRKSAVLKCGGYDNKLRRRQDYELFSRMIVHNKMAGANLSETLFLFRADDNYIQRNRNRESCKARVKVQETIYKRGDCSLYDYIYILFAMLMISIIPGKLYDYIYTKIVWKQRAIEQ